MTKHKKELCFISFILLSVLSVLILTGCNLVKLPDGNLVPATKKLPITDGRLVEAQHHVLLKDGRVISKLDAEYQDLDQLQKAWEASLIHPDQVLADAAGWLAPIAPYLPAGVPITAALATIAELWRRNRPLVEIAKSAIETGEKLPAEAKAIFKAEMSKRNMSVSAESKLTAIKKKNGWNKKT